MQLFTWTLGNYAEGLRTLFQPIITLPSRLHSFTVNKTEKLSKINIVDSIKINDINNKIVTRSVKVKLRYTQIKIKPEKCLINTIKYVNAIIYLH